MCSIMFDIFMRLSMSSILCLSFVEFANITRKIKAVNLSRQTLNAVFGKNVYHEKFVINHTT